MQTAKPLAAGESPTLTSVAVVVGETVKLTDTIVIDAAGQETAKGFTGTILPVAYIPLDQGGNLMPAQGVGLQEVIRVDGGKPETLPPRPAPVPEGGAYVDMQLIEKGQATRNVTQDVFIGQFPRSGGPATSLFRIGTNSITLNAQSGTVSITLGQNRRLR
jgi:hypothetical protein